MHVWNIRKSLCESNPVHYKKYTTSVLELSRLDSGVRPFFDPGWREEYAKSWMMDAPGYPDAVVDPGSSDITRQAEGSWFWAREYARNPEARHSDPSLVFSPALTPVPTAFSSRDSGTGESVRKRRKKMDSVAKKGAVLRCVRVRIKPTCEQKRVFRTCMGVYRHVYNECVTAEKNGLVHGTSNEEMVRWRTILTKRSNYVTLKPWKDACPGHTKQQAVEHFFRAKRGATTSSYGKQGLGRTFDMGYKSRYRSPKETFPLDRYKLWDNTEKNEKNAFFSFIYQRREMRMPVLGRLPACLRGRMDNNAVREEVKITRTRLGEWYAVISVEVCPSDRYENDLGGSMVSFDPGVKTFLTWHSTDGTWGEIGRFRPQEELLARADSLRSSLDSMGPYKNARWRRRIHRRYLAILERVRRRTRDLHNKVCSWATRRFRLILLPSFETSGMASSRRLRTRTCRKMMSWSHYAFKRRLVDAARKYGDVKVRICNESFTTKTCGSCGFIWDDMTLDDRVFRCGRCGMESTRDGNAARNVGLRALPFIVG